jgi:tetratricopeptide (TPR) repeat protein
MSCIDHNDASLLLEGAVPTPTMLGHATDCARCRRLLSELARAMVSTSERSISNVDHLPDWLPRGSRIERYVLDDQIGVGQSSAVYAAYDPTLDRRIALKVMRIAAPAVDRASDLLVREAKAMAKLAHPNVVTVHDAGAYGDRVYIAMELMPGGTLRTWLAARRRSWSEVRIAFLSAGRGLAAAHRAGIVHRDFKPDNVLVDANGRGRVSDFGLAGAVADDANGVPVFAGTPAYMAPELLRGEPASPASDQFAFCVTLYEALFDRRPFAGESPERLRGAIAAGELVWPERHGVPAHILGVLRRGLQAEPSARYRSMIALLAELAVDPGARRRRIAIASAGVVAIAVAVATHGYVTRARDERRVTECMTLASRLDAWDPPSRAMVVASFARDPHHQRFGAIVTDLLDRYATDLADARRSTCLATVRGDQTCELAAKREACLEARIDELGAFVAITRDPIKDAAALVDAASRLPAIDVCNDRDRLAAQPALADDPALRAELRRVRGKLATATVMSRALQGTNARTLLATVIDDARRLRWPTLEAEARVLLAATLRGSDPKEAVAEGYRGMKLAAALGMTETLGEAALAIAFGMIGTEDDAGAVGWAGLALALSDQTRSATIAARAHNALGFATSTLGDRDQAIGHLRQCVSLIASAPVPSLTTEMNCRSLLAGALVESGKVDEAIAEVSRSLERIDAAAPRMSVGTVIYLWSQMCAMLVGAHEEDRAIALADRGIAVYDKARAAADPTVTADDVTRGFFDLHRAMASLQRGQATGVVALLDNAERVLATWTEQQRLIWVLQAEAERQLHRFDRALAIIDRLHAVTGDGAWRARFALVAANTYLDLDRIPRAAALIAEAEKAAPTEPDLAGERWLVKARLATAQRRGGEVAALLRRARGEFVRSHHRARIAEIDRQLQR